MKYVLVFSGLLSPIFWSCRSGWNDTATESKLERSDTLEFAKKFPCKEIPRSFLDRIDIPAGPNLQLTSGELCFDSIKRRYSQQVKYCDRDVDAATKNLVFERYMAAHEIHRSYDRKDFKIDHFIPLCMGGSNEVKNLWPQHTSIGQFTDPVEPRLCGLLEIGRITQSEAIEIIKAVKTNYRAAYDACLKLDERAK